MTYERREEIFSKEALRVKDVQELMGCSPSKAAELIRDWKLKLRIGMGKTPRIDFEGGIHMLDYFEVMEIDPENAGDRYMKKKDTSAEARVSESARRSVCH